MNTIECTHAVQRAVNRLGSGFMSDAATFARAPEVGLGPGLGFYVLGRFGSLGPVPASVVASVASFFAPAAVEQLWTAGVATTDPRAAAALFSECAADWGRARLADVADLDAHNELAGRVVDAASVVAAPLFAALRELPRVDDAAGRCVQLAFCLRELRMARHVVAVLAEGLSPLEAILSGGGGEANAKMFGWAPPYPDVAGLRDRRAAAEQLTVAMHAVDFAPLSDAERDQLAAGYAAASAAAG